jgi:catechol 2,3-dioxygenase-like lactoylglutathione lyase family enzyme
MFAVPDVEAAAAFYRDRLGFEIRLIWGEPPFYAIAGRDKIAINFIQSNSAVGDAGDRGGAYLNVEGVDDLYEEMEDRGIEVRAPPEDKDYGMRDFILLGLNGYRLCFGERLRQ